MKIEDYAMIGDLQKAALVGRDGSLDWLCLPRFDSASCFTALLGDESHGRWKIAPAAGVKRCTRRYRPGSLVLETEMETDDGVVRLIDFMPVRDGAPNVVRIVEGVQGTVAMKMSLVIRFDYGETVPWVENTPAGMRAVGGPNALHFRSPVEIHGQDFTSVAEFKVRERERVPFTLAYAPSTEDAPPAIDPTWAEATTEAWWNDWSSRCEYHGEWHDQVKRSLVVLKGLIYRPTGGIVAAPTTSLPESIGGERNWDYRYCWLRDSALTLEALMLGGYLDEAHAFRGWLRRATAGHPSQSRIMYGIGGERLLPELELDWLPGYEDSKPVRVGNAASDQLQLDVFGELMYAARPLVEGKVDPEPIWPRARVVLDYLETAWKQPDDCIWEVRGPRRHFTHSKVMAWVAFDRAVHVLENLGVEGPTDRWRKVRDEIHDEVCREGFDAERNTFTQYYGSKGLDAATLMIPSVGFLPGDDPRVVGTVEAIREELMRDGFVYRYTTDEDGTVDGLSGDEGAFLPCSFWFVDALSEQGRHDEAREMFTRLLDVANDVGLIAEEYDPQAGRLLGNFPQAFSHLALVSSAARLSRAAEANAG
ncbi:MAG: glycoside hydrolase family 15 protein [Solirubrobacterales bacterium]